MANPVVVVLSAATLLIGLTGCPDMGLFGANPDQSPDPTTSPLPDNVHEGTISSNQTWTKAKSPHIVRGDVHVESASGVTLTIEPGTEVRFEAGAGLYFGWGGGTSGSLQAVGTSTESIIFTTASANKAKGSWNQIYVGDGGASTVMDYCQIAYGGGSGVESQSVLRVWGPTNKPTIRHCTFEENAGTAIMMDSAASFTAFENNTIKTSQASPIRLDANAVGSLGAGNTFVSNGLQAIEVVESDVTKNVRWRNHGLPYLLLGDIDVEAANTPVLTLDAGNTLRFAQGRQLRVCWGNESGALYAVGTSTDPITFTGVENNANPGAWEGIYLGNGAVNGSLSNSGTTCLKYVTIQYGGGAGGDTHGGLRIENSIPVVENVTIRNNAGYGLIVEGDVLNVPTSETLNSGITFSGNSVGTLNFLAQ